MRELSPENRRRIRRAAGRTGAGMFVVVFVVDVVAATVAFCFYFTYGARAWTRHAPWYVPSD